MSSSACPDPGAATGIIRDPLSRRGFLTGAGLVLGAGSATFLAACGGGGDDGARSEKDRDIAILEHALSLELTAVAAYRMSAMPLEGEALRTFEAFLAQEQEHADALTKAIKQRGGSAGAGPLRLEHRAIGGRRGALAFAADLEKVLIAAYLEAVPKLSASNLRAIAGEIVAVEAEHLAVIAGELGRPQAPDTFVGGDRQALSRAGLEIGTFG